jgi:aryl-alcohol dehydrogenase-like predicted oxidoreductase
MMTTSLPSLPMARLGWTDMLLTRVGFGAWAGGGGGWAYAWGDQDDAESIAAIRHAVESGVNWIDTAAVYGLGHSEEVVAAALAGLPEAREHEAGAIVYSPMASGLLTGAFTAGRAAGLDLGDWRAGDPDFQEPALSANLALAAALRPVAERHGVTPAAVAVAWTLSFPGGTGAIVGARQPGQVDGWLPAAALELKEDDLADIAAAIHATGAGTGPASPPLLAAHRR